MDIINSHGTWRLELAKQICKKINQVEGIQAIIVGGSVARGYTDEYSDIEIPIFWDKLPNDDVRKLIISELNASLLYPYNYEAMEDNLLINGFQVDLWHNTVSNENTIIDNVVNGLDMDLGNSNFLDTIRSCIPLYGDDIINAWKHKAMLYPDHLAVKNINENMKHLEIGQLELHNYRENPTLVYEHIIELQKTMFLILLALNHQYFPTFKWMYKSLETMNIKPKNIEQSFKGVYNCPLTEAVEETLIMVKELLSLINTLYPGINTSSVYERLKSTRKAHTEPVVLL